MAFLKSFPARRLLLFNQFCRTKKSEPAKMTSELREEIHQSYSGKYKTKSFDIPDDVSTIESY